MHAKKRISAWISGFALFSMFFGAGNLIFPLIIGQAAGPNAPSALGGLIVTAVLFPLVGLLAMMLYNANLDSFFGRIGRWPGWIVLFVVYMVLGPMGVIPRLFTVSYGALEPFLPGVNIWLFSAFAASLVFLLCLRKNRIVTLVGSVFTPILLLALGAIITLGLLHPSAVEAIGGFSQGAFTDGLTAGYGTSDLIAAFIFAPLIMSHFMRSADEAGSKPSRRQMLKHFAKASLIAAGLLGLVYGGLLLVAARFAPELAGIAPANLLGTLARLMLGPYGAAINAIAVSMACLTTAISLTAAFSDYIRAQWFRSRIGRLPCLAGSLVASSLVAPLGFAWIMTLLGPILDIAYPGLIVLCGLNIAHKLSEFRPVKIPVMTTFGLAALGHFV